MFGQLSVLLFSFSFFEECARVYGNGVWVNVFTMPFLWADSVPWRKMSRAWPPISAKTTLGTTCPSYREPAWWAAEARQEKVILDVVVKVIVVGKCRSICWTHVQMSLSVLVWARRLPTWSRREEYLRSFLTVAHHYIGQERTAKWRRYVWWVEGFAVCFSSVHGRMGMDVWVNVFTMPFLRADSGPWRQMSRAWPAMSAITTSSGSTCPSHQESAWGAAEPSQEKVSQSGKGDCCREMLEYLLNTSTKHFWSVLP